MKNTVILKRFPSGIAVIMDNAIPYDDLLAAIAEKFSASDNFFKGASVAISLEGRNLTEKQEREILDIITQNSHLNILCLMSRDEERNVKFLGIQNNVAAPEEENFGQFYKGSLKNGQSIETERSIIIVGNVFEGCSVYSAKDIVILGTLEGEAYAGAGGDNNHFIAALEMCPSLLRIGDYTYRPEHVRHSIWKPKPKPVPMIACAYNNEILVKPITKELLNSIL